MAMFLSKDIILYIILMRHLHFYDYSYDQTFDVCATETFKSVTENE